MPLFGSYDNDEEGQPVQQQAPAGITDSLISSGVSPGGGAGGFSNLAYGLDTTAASGGQPSLFDSLGNVITKAVPLTGLSIMNSFANTAIDVGNFFGLDNETLKVSDELDYLGAGVDYQDYYKEHEQGIEAAGLVIGSLLPGLGAVKGVSMGVKALTLAKAGYSTEILSAATGFLAPFKAKVLAGAMQEIEAGNAALYGSINADKLKAIALGFGDNYLQGVVYTAATAATMHASPLLDKGGFEDTLKDMFYGSLVPGIIGGGIEGIFTRSMFNKAIVTATDGAQAQQMMTYLGKGAFSADQRVVSLLHSVFDVPPPTNLLGSSIASSARNSAILTVKKTLQDLVPGDDPEVSNKVIDTLLKMKEQNSMDKEDIYNYLSGLGKITRNDAVPDAVSDNQFTYINRPTKPELNDGNFTFDDIFTDVPRYSFSGDQVAPKTVGTSQRFQFADGITKDDLKLSREGDPTTWTGEGTPVYPSAKAAFSDGMDLHIGPNARVMVNPDSALVSQVARPGENRALSLKEEKIYRATGNLPDNSKPLLGGAVVLDTSTGDIASSSASTVGDIGNIKMLDKGLSYGGKFSPQDMSTPITKDTSTLDASARYVWLAKRGLKPGDTVRTDDVAALEQVAREYEESGKNSFIEHIQTMKDRGIDFANEAGEEVPAPNSYQDLMNMLKDSKDGLLSDILKVNGRVSSQEAGIRANVPEDYIANGLASTTSKDYRLPIEAQSELRNVKLWYNIGNTNVQDGNILRGLSDVQYRVGLIKDQAQAAAAKILGDSWDNFRIDATSADASIKGVGSGLFSFANAAYQSLAGEVERVGRFVSLKFQHELVPKISTTLGQGAQALRSDPELAAEVGMFRAVRLRTNQDYVFLPSDLAAKYGLAEADGTSNITVLKNALVKDRNGNIIDWNKNYIPDSFIDGDHFDLAKDFNQTGNFNYYRLSQGASDWERSSKELNSVRVANRNIINTASGMSKTLDPSVLYTPPVNTANFSHFAYVRVKPGVGMGDSDVSVITAENAADLESKIAAVKNMGEQYEVFTKADIKNYHEVIGDYEYSRNFSQTQTNGMLQRAGVLNNVFPQTRAENTIKDYLDWHSRQEMVNLRDTTELLNGQLFAELRAMGERFTSAETSKTGFVPATVGRTATNPYDSYVRTALGISNKENYRFLADLNERVESTFSTAFRVAKQAFKAAVDDKLPFDQANAMSQNFGLGDVYGNSVNVLQQTMGGLSVGEKNYGIANKLPPERLLSKFLGTAGAILGNTVIKLDTFQQFIHAVSTPILMFAEANSASNQLLKQLTSVEIPDGAGKLMPSASKVGFNAIANYFKSDVRNEWLPQFKQWGLIHDTDTINEHFALQDALTLPYGRWSENGVATSLQKATALGRKLSGTDLSDSFTGFIAADTGRQLGQAAGLTDKALMDFVIQFSNRVKGNNIASQRPVAFQGPIGQAIGLFQTYQFNMMQQLYRYVENGEGKTLAILAGLQTSLFGMQSLPGFQAINNHIIGNAALNPGHTDLYGTSWNLLDKKLGDWMLYGSVSNTFGAGLYTRGDMNPRNLTVLPINPLNYPAISGAIRFASNLYDTASKIAKGGSIPSSLMMGLEHNGLSRPLSGIAQLAQGYTTDDSGKLIDAHPLIPNALGDNSQGYSEMLNMANFSRLLGARPLDEAVTMDAMYRRTLYMATDTARMAKLGEAARSTMIGNNVPDTGKIQDFAAEYAASGGHIGAFSRTMHTWNQQANSAVANKVYKAMQDPRGQAVQRAMGGQPLPDFRNTSAPPVQATAPQQQVSGQQGQVTGPAMSGLNVDASGQPQDQ